MSDKNIGMIVALDGADSERVDGFSIRTYDITVSAVAGDITKLVHGLDTSKIVSIDAILGGANVYPKAYTLAPQYEFHVRVSSSEIYIQTTASNSSNILGQKVTVTIIYKG